MRPISGGSQRLLLQNTALGFSSFCVIGPDVALGHVHGALLLCRVEGNYTLMQIGASEKDFPWRIRHDLQSV